MCRIANLCLLQRLKGSMPGDARDFNNIETRVVIKFFFSCKAIFLSGLHNLEERAKQCIELRWEYVE